MKANFKDYLHLHFIVFVWGFTAVLGDLISIPAVELVFWRTLLAFGGMAAYMRWRRVPLRIERRALLPILLTGSLIAAHWILFFAAAKVANVSICLVGLASVTLWTSILEPLINRQRIKWLEVLLGGVMIFGLYRVFAAEFSYALGLVFAIVSALLGALFSILNARLVKQYHYYSITLYEMLGAWATCVLFLPFYKTFWTEELKLMPTLTDWVYLSILSGICTVYAFSASVKLMKKFTAFAVNLTVNLEPVYGILLAFWLLDEAKYLSTDFFTGGSIILTAVLAYPVLNYWFYGRKKKTHIEPMRATHVD